MVMIVHVARTMNADPSIDTIISDFRATMSELKCASSERLLRLGVSMAQLNIMYTLHRNGEMTMSHLADVLNVSFSSATGLIDRMEERDFIERIRVPEDRRIVVVRLTAAGEALLEEVDALSADLLRRVLSGLDAAQLDAMAQAIADLRAAVATDTMAAPERHPVSTPAPRSPSTMRGAEGPSRVERSTAHDLATTPSRRD
jgi:DNA-binding MarR family transcriptional regulator